MNGEWREARSRARYPDPASQTLASPRRVGPPGTEPSGSRAGSIQHADNPENENRNRQSERLPRRCDLRQYFDDVPELRFESPDFSVRAVHGSAHEYQGIGSGAASDRHDLQGSGPVKIRVPGRGPQAHPGASRRSERQKIAAVYELQIDEREEEQARPYPDQREYGLAPAGGGIPGPRPEGE